MESETHGRLLFGLGLLSLIILVIGYLFLEELFYDTFPQARRATEATVQPSAELGFDPLVTVVEEDRFPKIPQPLETDPVRGDILSPAVTIIEFGDFECDGCAAMKPVLEELLALFPDDLQHVWKDFPIPSQHQYAETAALAARCAQEQDTFWAYHDRLLERQDQFVLQPWTEIAAEVALDTDQFEACMELETPKQRIAEGFLVARSLELESTPSYYIGERRFVGVQELDTLVAAVEEALAAQ